MWHFIKISFTNGRKHEKQKSIIIDERKTLWIIDDKKSVKINNSLIKWRGWRKSGKRLKISHFCHVSVRTFPADLGVRCLLFFFHSSLIFMFMFSAVFKSWLKNLKWFLGSTCLTHAEYAKIVSCWGSQSASTLIFKGTLTWSYRMFTFSSQLENNRSFEFIN